MPEVSVVIVCMGGPQKHLEACLEGLRTHTRVPYELLVVAYLWPSQEKEAFAKAHPEVSLIPSDEPRGVAENNNLALPLAKGRYCLLLNDDTRLYMPVVDALVSDFKRLPSDAAVLCPCIRFADGRLQTCGRAPWTPFRYALHYLHLVHEARPGRWNLIPECASDPGLFRTFTLNGACFLIRTDVFRSAGWLDQRFFFTPEDIALGHRLNDFSYSVWADAYVSITHLAGGSVSQMEQAVKPARVRGSLIFYGEPLLLKLFICAVEALRYVKNGLVKPRTAHSMLMRRTAANVLRTVFSRETPKAIFLRFKP